MSWLYWHNLLESSPLCGPSRSNLLTGRRSDHSGIERNNDGKDMPQDECVNVAAQAVGYQTGIAGKWQNSNPDPDTGVVLHADPGPLPAGWDFGWLPFADLPSGFSVYLGYNVLHTDGSIEAIENINDPDHYCPDLCFTKSIEWLEDNASPAGPPVFLYVAPESPHYPWTPAARHATATVTPIPEPSTTWQSDVSTQPAWIQAIPEKNNSQIDAALRDRRDARRTMLAVDEGIEALLDSVESLGIADNTVFIFLTDNGAQWARFRRLGVSASLWRKSTNYPETIRASCYMRWPEGIAPGSRPNIIVVISDDMAHGDVDTVTTPLLHARMTAEGGTRTINEMATTLDITATLYHLMGAEPPVVLDGVTLAHLAADRPVLWRSAQETTMFPIVEPTGDIPAWWGVRRADGVMYAYWRQTGEEELYLGTDPNCTVSVHADPAHADLLAECQAVLAARQVQSEGQVLDAGRPYIADGVKTRCSVGYGDGVAVETVVRTS